MSSNGKADLVELARLMDSLTLRGFYLARLATGSDTVAVRLVGQAQQRIARLQGSELLEARQMFYRVLESDIQVWLWMRRVREKVKRGWRRLRGDKHPAATSLPVRTQMASLLTALPYFRQQAFLLQQFENFSLSQAADILGCSPASVRHPLLSREYGKEISQRQQTVLYRQKLRHAQQELEALPNLLTADLRGSLNSSGHRALRQHLPTERQALYLWQRAMKQSLTPTGLSLLVMLIVALLVGWLF